MRRAQRGVGAALVLGIAGGATVVLSERASESAPDGTGPAAPATSATPAAVALGTTGSPLGLRSVDVFFAPAQHGCDRVAAVRRDVPSAAPLRPAIEALFAGPTAEEQEVGLVGFAVPGLLRSVRLLDGVVYMDLRAERFPGAATTSCGSALFTGGVGATVRGIVPGADVVVALDGDPRAYVQALQGECLEPIGRGDPCDASGFG